LQLPCFCSCTHVSNQHSQLYHYEMFRRTRCS
jgi:hypothetical protein